MYIKYNKFRLKKYINIYLLIMISISVKNMFIYPNFRLSIVIMEEMDSVKSQIYYI